MKDHQLLSNLSGFAADQVTWVVIALVLLYGAAGLWLSLRSPSPFGSRQNRQDPGAGRGLAPFARTACALALAAAAASATNFFVLMVIVGLQGQLLAIASGAKGSTAAAFQRGADLLLGIALVELWRQGAPSDFSDLTSFAATRSDSSSLTLAGICLAGATVVRMGVVPFSDALAPLRRPDDAGRLLELSFGPGFSMIVLCARAASIFRANEDAALVLTVLAVLAGAVGTQRALIARRRRGLLQGLALAHTALALILVAQGAPAMALTAMLTLGMALGALWLMGEVLRQEQGHDDLYRGGRALRRRPLLGLVAAGVAGSLAGVPPTLGFTALDAVRWQAIAGGPGQGWLLWAAVLLIGAGAAAAAARWWILSFLKGSVDQERRRDCDAQARVALAVGAILIVATPLAAPSWTGLPNVLGELLVEGLDQRGALKADVANEAFFSRSRSSAATGGAFGLIGAMATLAGIYLALRLETRDPKYLRRLIQRSGIDDERAGPRFLARYLGTPTRDFARRITGNPVAAHSAAGLPVRIARAVDLLGQRLAGLQNGSFRFYAAVGLIATLLLLLSLAR